jgi:type I restriction enzyme S subunit
MAASLPPGTTAPRGLPLPDQIRWPLFASRDLFELRYGRALVEAHRRPGFVPVYGTNGRCGSHDKALFKGPGVILGRKGQGPLGVEWSQGDYWVIDTAYSLLPLRSDIDLKYAYFLVKHIGLNHLKDGTSNPTLSRDSFGAQALPLPPLNAQRAIAHILGTLDDKIELNRKMNETLEAMARAIFKSWFIDFDPVRRNAIRSRNQPSPRPTSHTSPTGRGDGDEGVAADLAYNHLFPDSFEYSELGEIPKGWGLKAFADTIEIVGGGTPRTSVAEYWGGDIPWFSVVDAPTNSEVWAVDTEKKVTRAGVENSSTRVLPVGTTIISARGTVGRISLVGVPMAMNQSCYGLRGRAGTHGFFNYFSTRELVARLQQHAHGSVFDTITRDTLASVSVVAPAAVLIEEFEKRVAPSLQRIRSGLLEIRALAALRDTLLPKLISGEIRVNEGEEIVEEAS